MALIGNGAVAFVGLNEGAADAVDSFYQRVSHPALTDITVDWGDLKVSDVYPQRVPDLFVGRPVVLTGRFEGDGKATIRIRGTAGGKAQEIVYAVDAEGAHRRHQGLASMWARMKIADLENAQMTSPRHAGLLPGEIKNIALEYGLVSAYTAFVAVDASTRTAGNHGTTVVQPVPMPEGVRYDTTVPE